MEIAGILGRYVNREEIAQLAIRQGLGALLYDEVKAGGCTVGREDLLRLYRTAQRQAKEWEIQKEDIGRLDRFCGEHGLRMLLMKGYALSRLYDSPESRKCGDVDVYFFGADGKASCRPDSVIEGLLGEEGILVMKGEKHSCFDLGSTHVEWHHHFVGVEEHPRLRAVETFLLRQIEASGVSPTEELRPGDRLVKSGEWSNVYFPSANFNAVFLPIHMGEHFVYEGATLRQLVDWEVFRDKCGELVDWAEVLRLADEGGYRRWLEAMNRREERVIRELVHSVPIDRETRKEHVLLYAWGRTLRTIREGWKIRMVYGEWAIGWFWRHAWRFLLNTENLEHTEISWNM